MSEALILASELTEKTLWNPTILGVLVVVSGIALFCGSVYLLLATNMGARLGFLVAASALTGLMVLMSTVWLSTATPLNSPKGRIAGWMPEEVVTTFDDSTIGAIAEIETDGSEVPPELWGDIRPAVDAALVIGSTEGEEESEFAIVPTSADVIIQRSFETGGEAKWIFWHEPKYQAVEFCLDDNSDDPETGSLEVEPEPVCDPAVGTSVIVFERDLGSLRQPPAMYLFAFLALFVLSLLGLYWREKDQRAAAAAK